MKSQYFLLQAIYVVDFLPTADFQGHGIWPRVLSHNKKVIGIIFTSLKNKTVMG
jgi:hypothetical protein